VDGCQRRDNLTARSTNRSSITVVVVTENRDSLKNKSFVEPPISQPVVAVPSLRGCTGWAFQSNSSVT
jgi:hypothetical protein